MTDINENKLRNARARLSLSQTEAEPYPVSVCGLRFQAHPKVFSPKYFSSTELMNERFPFYPDETFLEIGCGIGVTSILAGLHHNNRVVCTDISGIAIKIANENIERHGLAGRVEARQSNVFSSIRLDERFDTIYWDLPFIYAPESYSFQSHMERSVCDPGYRAINEFLREARHYLRKNGRLLAGFGSNGDLPRFQNLIRANGYNLRELQVSSIAERGGLSYTLFQLISGDSS